MNKDVLQGQWKQIRGKAKQWWGKLTDDDLDMIDGKRQELMGKLQEKYGYTKEEATREIETRLKDWQAAIEETP